MVRLNYLLGLSCILIVIFICFQISISLPNVIPKNTKAKGLSAQKQLEALSKKTLNASDFRSIFEKPLFNEKRKKKESTTAKPNSPLPKKTEPVTPTSFHPLPELLGVLNLNGIKTGFVTTKKSSTPEQLIEGEEYEGWKIISLSETTMTLKQGEKEEVLSIKWSN
jgi:hypothetical protein